MKAVSLYKLEQGSGLARSPRQLWIWTVSVLLAGFLAGAWTQAKRDHWLRAGTETRISTEENVVAIQPVSNTPTAAPNTPYYPSPAYGPPPKTADDFFALMGKEPK